MCAEGMGPVAILVLAMVATSTAAPRQLISNRMSGSAREPVDIRCAPAMCGGTWKQWCNAVVTCRTAKRWKKELSRPFHGGTKGCQTTHAARLKNGLGERRVRFTDTQETRIYLCSTCWSKERQERVVFRRECARSSDVLSEGRSTWATSIVERLSGDANRNMASTLEISSGHSKHKRVQTKMFIHEGLTQVGRRTTQAMLRNR